MANISEIKNVHDGAEVTNWISQINAGNTVYDIATHHGITFKDGSKGESVIWNGLTDIEVIIPSIADIVQSPIVFAGTVNKDGVDWNDTHKDGPKEGYLVFVIEDCTFNEFACEAGDMAIYDGSKWNIVSGENQVKITGTTNADIKDENRTVVAVGAAKDVLEVEGKALSLELDYADIAAHFKTTGGAVTDANLDNVTVKSKSIKLEQGNSSEVTLSTDVKFDNATALADGTVTFTGVSGLVSDVTFGKFEAGLFPGLTLNAESKTFEVTGGSLTTVDGEDFVKSIRLAGSEDGANDAFSMITGISRADGTEFLKGIHITGADETSDLSIEGILSTETSNVKFVEGLKEGAPVTSINGGSFELTENGSDIVTGLVDTTEGAAGDVISSVSVVANNDTSVLASATVSDHVLSFTPANVTSGVTVTTSSKSLVKKDVNFTPASVATYGEFKTSGFTTNTIGLTFSKGAESTYTATSAWYKLEATKGGYSIDNTGMIATVPAKTFGVSMTEGTLPSLGESSVVRQGSLTGSVATALSVNPIEFKALTVDKIDLPGAYSLAVGDGDGSITVGAEGKLEGVGSVDLTGYLTGAEIVTTLASN